MKIYGFLYIALLLALMFPSTGALATAPEAVESSAANQVAQFQGTLFFPVFEPSEPVQQYHIVKLDLATGNRETLLENASQPAVNHTGDAITYKSWIPDQQVYGLHAAQLSDIAGTSWRYSDSIADQRPQWPPNDSFFYFHTRRESDRQDRLMVTQGDQVSGIFRPDMDDKEILGKSPTVVTSGDGYAILYQGCEYSNCGIWHRSLNGANPVQITEEPTDQGLSASPDGKWVAFMSHDRERALDWEVYVMAADGSNVRRLSNRPGIDGVPTWSSDGQWIAFARETDPGSNSWDIMAIRPDGTGEAKLSELGVLHGQVKGTTPDQCLGWMEETISWVGTGAEITEEESQEEKPEEPIKTEPISEAVTPEPAVQPETDTAEVKTEPTPEPVPAKATGADGFNIYPAFDASNGRDNYDLVMIDLTTLEKSTVLSDVSQPALSSDGTWIAYKAWGQDRKKQGLHAAALADLEGTDWQFTPAQEAQRPSWVPGDLFFSFYSRQESDHNNRVMITQGSQAVTIQRPDVDNKEIEGITPVVFIDQTEGDYMVYQGCEGTECGAWSRALSGENPTQITENTSDQAFSQSPDGQWIAFMSYSRDGAQDWEVYLMKPDGSQLRRLTEHPGHDGLPTWSPDGQWIAFVRETEPASNNWDIMTIRPDGTGEKELITLGALDGRVKGTTSDQNKGWLEEQIAWGAAPTE